MVEQKAVDDLGYLHESLLPKLSKEEAEKVLGELREGVSQKRIKERLKFKGNLKNLFLDRPMEYDRAYWTGVQRNVAKKKQAKAKEELKALMKETKQETKPPEPEPAKEPEPVAVVLEQPALGKQPEDQVKKTAKRTTSRSESKKVKKPAVPTPEKPVVTKKFKNLFGGATVPLLLALAGVVVVIYVIKLVNDKKAKREQAETSAAEQTVQQLLQEKTPDYLAKLAARDADQRLHDLQQRYTYKEDWPR